MQLPLSPEQVRAFFDQHRTVRQYVTAPDGSALPLPPEHLDTILHAAQRAPTDATAQLYSIIHLQDAALSAEMAHLTANAHVATASAAFVLCADAYRVSRILEAAGYEAGEWPAIGVHFGIGDAVMAGTNLLIAAEMLGYSGCWIGGVLNNLPEICDRLKLPAGVLPFAALTIGRPAENAPYRPRLPRPLVVHANHYQPASPSELQAATNIMNPIAARGEKPGDWGRLLNAYFGADMAMSQREGVLVKVLGQQKLLAQAKSE